MNLKPHVRLCLPQAKICVLILLCVSASGCSKGSDWETLNEEVKQQLSAGNYEQAEIAAKRAFEHAEKNCAEDHWHFTTSLNNLATVYKRQGRFDEAEPLYVRSLAIREKVQGPKKNATFITALNNLASLHVAQGRYVDAEPLYQRVLAITEQGLGPDHPQVAEALTNLAIVHVAQLQYDAALPLCERSLAIWYEAEKSNVRDLASHLANLAAVYRAMDREQDAQAIESRIRTMHEPK